MFLPAYTPCTCTHLMHPHTQYHTSHTHARTPPQPHLTHMCTHTPHIPTPYTRTPHTSLSLSLSLTSPPHLSHTHSPSHTPLTRIHLPALHMPNAIQAPCLALLLLTQAKCHHHLGKFMLTRAGLVWMVNTGHKEFPAAPWSLPVCML